MKLDLETTILDLNKIYRHPKIDIRASGLVWSVAVINRYLYGKGWGENFEAARINGKIFSMDDSSIIEQLILCTEDENEPQQ